MSMLFLAQLRCT